MSFIRGDDLPENTSDEPTHILGRLGEGIFKTNDAREDLREGHKGVGQGLHPDADVRGSQLRDAILIAGIVAAWRFLVDVVLGDRGTDHGTRAEHESQCHLLDGREVPALLGDPGVQPLVDDRDEDDEHDRVQILDDVVGSSVQSHCRRLVGQII
jgi:hypothetical protein